MVADSGQLHCFCMGHIVSKHRTGKEGNDRKFDIVKYFCRSIFVSIKRLNRGKRNFFNWYSYGDSFNYFPVDYCCGF